MENQQQQRPCDNCKKSFPTDKVDLHEAYCFRNIKKCSKCQKMIDINEQQSHDLQEHSNKQCDMCSQQFAPSQFESHLKSCPQKPVDCQFCQNTYTLIQIPKHKQSCGSRTQPCLLCHKNVMIKEFTEHTQKCKKRAEQRRSEQRRVEQRRAEVSQDAVRNRIRNQNEAPLRERQNSQSVRDKQKPSSTKNIVQKPPTKVKPTHIIGPQSIRPMIDPVPISVRLAMKTKDQNRLPLKSKN